MVEGMKYRELAKLLKDAGFVKRQGKGDHEVWRCGSVSVSITHTRTVSFGVTRKALKAIERSKEQ